MLLLVLDFDGSQLRVFFRRGVGEALIDERDDANNNENNACEFHEIPLVRVGRKPSTLQIRRGRWSASHKGKSQMPFCQEVGTKAADWPASFSWIKIALCDASAT